MWPSLTRGTGEWGGEPEGEDPGAPPGERAPQMSNRLWTSPESRRKLNMIGIS